MKNRFLFLILLFLLGIAITSCNRERKYRPDTAIVTAFNNKFPEAKQIEWEQKAGYQVVEFEENGVKSEVWFDTTGRWLMTANSLKYSALSQPIRKQFEQSSYANWKKEEIDKIERSDMSPIYVIEVEKEGQNTYLYYKEDGTFIKALDNIKQGDIKYMPLNPVIKDQIAQRYPEATIIETDREKGILEIDILDNGKSKEVIYSGENWVLTFWEVRKAEVPSATMDAYRHSAYGKYRLNDLYFYETPENFYYLFELEQGNSKVQLFIDTHGNIIQSKK